MAATSHLPLISELKVSTIKQTHKHVLPEQIKAAMQPVSSNMWVIVKILKSNLVVLSLISSLIFIKSRHIRVQIMLIQISSTQYKKQGPVFYIFSISHQFISFLLLVGPGVFKLLYMLYNFIQNLVTPITIYKITKFI